MKVALVMAFCIGIFQSPVVEAEQDLEHYENHDRMTKNGGRHQLEGVVPHVVRAIQEIESEEYDETHENGEADSHEEQDFFIGNLELLIKKTGSEIDRHVGTEIKSLWSRRVKFHQIAEQESEDSTFNKISSDRNPDREKDQEIRLKERNGRMIEKGTLKGECK